MKSKPDLDRDWPAPSRWQLGPFRSIRHVMIVVAAGGMLLAFTATMARQPLSSMITWDPSLGTAGAVPGRLGLYQGPFEAREGLVIACPIETHFLAALQAPGAQAIPDTTSQPLVMQPQPRDPAVVIASESIDPRMVVQAPAWIDPKMVVTSPGGDWQPEQGGSPAPAPGVPGVAPGAGLQYKLIPAPDGSTPPATQPQFELVPVPNGSTPPATKPQYKHVPVPNGSSPPATKPRR